MFRRELTKILGVYKRNICGGVVQYEMLSGPQGMKPAHKLTTVLDGAALSHSLCLDMNGKERNQRVVNTGDSMYRLPDSLSIHISVFNIAFVSNFTLHLLSTAGLVYSHSGMIS